LLNAVAQINELAHCVLHRQGLRGRARHAAAIEENKLLLFEFERAHAGIAAKGFGVLLKLRREPIHDQRP
jgi:hypothetical protein